MDDKEKEKFGVIIDKNNQSEDEKPQVEDNTAGSQSTNQKNDDQNQNLSKEQPKVDNLQNDKLETSSESTNLSFDEKQSSENNNENTQNVNENENVEKNNEEEKKEHQVIHKKDGRLHIYVRQDKYKGELKSKNWVGRLYKDGKQKISSSGTPNLDDAIPILEKWFDDVHSEKEKEKENLEQQVSSEVVEKIETPVATETKPSQEVTTQVAEQIKPSVKSVAPVSQKITSEDTDDAKPKNLLEKLKNIKFKAPSFGKGDGKKLNFKPGTGKVKEKFNNFLKSRLGKKTAQGEEIVGVEITKKAIDTNSLWENLVQLTDNLDDYSIFHQVINRNPKDNTMDILFVASKLTDINNYTSIIKNSGLNPVIIDVKCFALKSAVDQINQISNKTEDTNFTALLEFGLDENYVMILYNNNPIITDIFLRGQDRKILKESKDQEEKDALVRRFMTQVKQAVQDFETKYEKRVRNIKVVSNLENVEDYLSSFRKSLVNTGFNLFDPFDGLKIPQQLEGKVNLQNRSYFSTVVGLAFRKLDVFGYYKFVTAVKNINLLPNREGMIKQKKMKAFSNFAYKGFVGAVAGIYLILFTLAFWNIYRYNSQLQVYDTVLAEHKAKEAELAKINKELKKMTTTLKLSNSLKSNKDLSYRILAQIASSVPNRVKFNAVDYNGKRQVVITGIAAGDNDILQLIRNLQAKSLIKQASLSSMKMPNARAGEQIMKGFKVFVKVGG